MTATNIPVGSEAAVLKQLDDKGLFSIYNRDEGDITRLLRGKMPTQANASASIRGEQAANMPIVVSQDLTKEAGSEIQIKFVQTVSQRPIMGDKIAIGKGAGQEIEANRFKIDQVRFPFSVGGKMSQQRTNIKLYDIAKDQGMSHINRYSVENDIIHMAGARGTRLSNRWAIPLESDEEFSDFIVNPVLAPTRNRSYIATSSGVQQLYDGSFNEPDAAGKLSIQMLDALQAEIEEMAYPINPIKFPNDAQADSAPIYVLLVTPLQYNQFRQSNSHLFNQWLSSAQVRSNANPVFRRDSLLYGNILISKFNDKFVRFTNGSTLKYCAAYDTETESSHTVACGAGYAIDRAILVGAQALHVGFGGNTTGTGSFFWEEEKSDFGNRREVVVGMMAGCQKTRFKVDHGGTLGKQYTDLGVMTIDTLVTGNF